MDTLPDRNLQTRMPTNRSGKKPGIECFFRDKFFERHKGQRLLNLNYEAILEPARSFCSRMVPSSSKIKTPLGPAITNPRT